MGRSALWHARHNGSKECATILLNTGLPSDYGLVPAAGPENISNNATAEGDFLTQSTFNPQSATLINGNAKFRKQTDAIENCLNKDFKAQQKHQQFNKTVINDNFQCLPASII